MLEPTHSFSSISPCCSRRFNTSTRSLASVNKPSTQKLWISLKNHSSRLLALANTKERSSLRRRYGWLTLVEGPSPFLNDCKYWLIYEYYHFALNLSSSSLYFFLCSRMLRVATFRFSRFLSQAISSRFLKMMLWKCEGIRLIFLDYSLSSAGSWYLAVLMLLVKLLA